MFDYQAGEKYKLTLIMVGFAGLMAGMLFTMLVMPQPDPRAMKARKAPAWTKDPDAGYGRGPRAYHTAGRSACCHSRWCATTGGATAVAAPAEI